jgi:hypothetical protein
MSLQSRIESRLAFRTSRSKCSTWEYLESRLMIESSFGDVQLDSQLQSASPSMPLIVQVPSATATLDSLRARQCGDPPVEASLDQIKNTKIRGDHVSPKLYQLLAPELTSLYLLAAYKAK